MVYVESVGEIFVCDVCGNVVEVVELGGGELSCCDQPMKLEEEVDLGSESDGE